MGQQLPPIGAEVPPPSALPPIGAEVPQRPADFTAHAEIPTAEEFAAAQTPTDRIALLARTPVGQDLAKVKDLFNLWVDKGPHAVVEGLKKLTHGEYAKGAHEAITGAGLTAAPMLVPGLIQAAIAAPAATALGAVGAVGAGYAGQKVAETGATALGASPDQATLAGDVGRLASMAGVKVSGLIAARVAARPLSAKAIDRAMTDVIKAVPPSNAAPYRPTDLQRARPYLEAVHTSEPITSVESFTNAADRAITDIETHIGQYVQAYPGEVLPTKPLDAATAVLKRSPRTDALKAGLQELESLHLDRPMELSAAEAARRQLNAENTGILKRNHYDVETARKVDPGFAAREAAAASLRDGIYGTLERLGVPGVAELRRDEGALIAVRNAAQRQIFAGEKPVPGTSPSTLRQAAALGVRTLPVPAVVADPVARVVRGSAMTRDAMLERAFGPVLTKGPVYPPVPVVPDVSATGDVAQ